MKRISPGFRQFIYYLNNQYNYFRKNNKLAQDGSFFKDDDTAAEKLGVSSRSIKRYRKYAAKLGIIRYEPGKHRGKATKYWILRKGDSLSPSLSKLKIDKMTNKDDKLVEKGIQADTPYKESIEEKNKEGTIIKDVYLLRILERWIGKEGLENRINSGEITLSTEDK